MHLQDSNEYVAISLNVPQGSMIHYNILAENPRSYRMDQIPEGAFDTTLTRHNIPMHHAGSCVLLHPHNLTRVHLISKRLLSCVRLEYGALLGHFLSRYLHAAAKDNLAMISCPLIMPR